MKKTNIIHKKINTVSPNLSKSPTSKADPQIYNSACSKNWEVDNGLVNTQKYRVNKYRWDPGFPAELDNA